MDKLPKGWKLFKLSDVCDVRDGTHDSPKFHDEGFPLVTSKNLKNNNLDLENVKYINQTDYDNINKRSKVEIGDILFAMIGTIGNPILIKEEPKFAIKNVALFKKSEKIVPNFLVHFLSASFTLEKMISEAKGATQKFVGLGYLRQFEIPLPPLPEQKRIVSKLDALFERIDKSIALLEENIKQTEHLMASALDEVFKNVPADKFLPILNTCLITNKNIIPKENEDYNYIGLENIESQTGRLVDFSITRGNEIKSSKIVFKKGAILYGKLRPYLNKVHIAEFDGVCTTEILPFYPNEEILTKEYLTFYLRSERFVNEVNNNTSGARMPRATTFFFKKVAKVPVPSINEQDKQVHKLERLSKNIFKLNEEQKDKLNNLKSLKESILDKAFKGEL